MAGAFLQWRARKATAMLGQNWRSCGGFGATRGEGEREANEAGDSVGQARRVLMLRPAAPGCPWRMAARAKVRRRVANTRRSLSNGC